MDVSDSCFSPSFISLDLTLVLATRIQKQSKGYSILAIAQY